MGALAEALAARIPSKVLTPAWSTIGSFPGGAAGAPAVSTDGSRIFVTHGVNAGAVDTRTYVITPGTTVNNGAGAPAPNARAGAAGAWSNGRHYAISGAIDAGLASISGRVDAYTPGGVGGASGTWATVADVTGRVYGAAAVVDTLIYFAGGQTSASTSAARAELFRYDTVTNTWSGLVSMPAARTRGSLVAVGTKLYYSGGLDTAGTNVATVFIYDTVAGTWSTGGPLPTGHRDTQGAAVGTTIYLLGGRNAGGAVSAAPMTYNTLTGTGAEGAAATGIPTMLDGHDFGGTVAMGSRVYVVTGFANATVDVFDSAAVTDLAPVSWQFLSALTARNGMATTTDGTRLYITHGAINGSGTASNAGVYASFDGTVSGNIPAATTARAGVAGVWCNGRHWVFGGRTAGTAASATNALEAYTPAGVNGATGTWATLTGAAYNLGYPAGAAVGNTLYFAGGVQGGGTTTTNFLSYNTDTLTWTDLTATKPLPAARASASMVAVGTKLYLLGGSNGTALQSTIYIYDTVAQTWTTSTTTLPAIAGAGSATAVGTSIWIYAGPSNTIYVIDTLTMTITTSGAALTVHGNYSGMAAANGTIYLTSGASTPNLESLNTTSAPAYVRKVRALKSFLLANEPAIGAVAAQLPETMPVAGWSSTTTLSASRHSAAVTTDGTNIYISQGLLTDGTSLVSPVSVPLTAPSTSITMTTTGAFTADGNANVFVNGFHTVISGSSGGTTSTSVQRYRPAGNAGASGTWSAAAAMSPGALYASAAVLGGLVYVAGGNTGATVATATNAFRRYDPIGNTWTTLQAMPVARTQGALVAVGTKLYYLGGLDPASIASSAIYVFDTGAGTWSTGSLTLPGVGSGNVLQNAVTIGSVAYCFISGYTALRRIDLSAMTYLGNTDTFAFTHGQFPGLVVAGTNVYIVSGSNTVAVERNDPISVSNYARNVALIKSLAALAA